MPENVKVAVRVRPFNDREREKGSSLIVTMTGKTTTIINPDDPRSDNKSFHYDHSYWSHDGFMTRESDGCLVPNSRDSKYIGQDQIYNDLGRDLLLNAWGGYNATIFAYGQTSSGKSYSIMGHGVNKGMVPRLCEDLFQTIDQRKQEGVVYEVTFSMFEIYNEEVRDLLNKKANPKGGLAIRERPGQGFYVSGLTEVAVSSFKEISLRINEGDRFRTIAATAMNETSSRAHTIVTVQLAQRRIKENITKMAKINLVDLAGSEQAKQTQATGHRFEESKNINKSLLMLGLVIKAAAKKTGQPNVRNSKLTKILKNALGGNSKTIMVAAISPSSEHYEQTKSTLRYADQAKSIRNTAEVNESATDTLIKGLLAEKEKLLKELNEEKMGKQMGYTEADIQELKKVQEEEIRRYKKEMEDINLAWQQRLENDQKAIKVMLDMETQERDDRHTHPHFGNLNEDPALTNKIYHVAKIGKSVVGNNKASPKPDIILNGPGIAKEHAIVQNDKGVVSISHKDGKILINGQEIKEQQKLHHLDRVAFDPRNLFVYYNPGDAAKLKKEKQTPQNITYELAQKEIAKHSGLDMTNEDSILEQEVLSVLPLVQDACAIAVELNKPTEFEICLLSALARGQKEGRTELWVKMLDKTTNNEFRFNRNEFINRQSAMRDIYHMYEEGDPDWNPTEQDKDPFWEPSNRPLLAGITYIPMSCLAYGFDLQDSFKVMDYRGEQAGFLDIALVPCSQSGQEDIDLAVLDPSELIGKNLSFKVKIKKANGLMRRLIQVWCKYYFYKDKEYVVTPEVNGPSPEVNFLRQHHQRTASSEFIDYLKEDDLIIEVWGRQGDSGVSKRSRTSLGTASSEKDEDEREKRHLQAELIVWKRKADVSQEKLNRISAILQKSEGAADQTLDHLRSIIDGELKREDSAVQRYRSQELGDQTSQACIIQ